MNLVNDVILIICQYIDDDQCKYRFLSTCKQGYNLMDQITFTWYHDIDDIYDTKYYNQCINIYMYTLVNYKTNDRYIFHKNIKGIIFEYDFNEDIKNYLPNTIKRLEFEGKCKVSINTIIPSSVIDLTFNNHFIYTPKYYSNKKSNIVGLDYDCYDIIPSTVKYLTFNGKSCRVVDINQIKIPEGVLHLNLGNEYKANITIYKLPTSLLTLTLSKKYKEYFDKIGCQSLKCNVYYK